MTLHVPMLDQLSDQVMTIIKDHPLGLKQSQIAAKLGIPYKEDNNWITYYVLKSMVHRNLVTKDDKKVYRLV